MTRVPQLTRYLRNVSFKMLGAAHRGRSWAAMGASRRRGSTPTITAWRLKTPGTAS